MGTWNLHENFSERWHACCVRWEGEFYYRYCICLELGLLSWVLSDDEHLSHCTHDFGPICSASFARSLTYFLNVFVVNCLLCLGFSTFHEVTYPLTTTTIVTDGREFSFFASQLNTLLLHDEFIDVNPKVNVCYSVPTLELYQNIEGSEFIGKKLFLYDSPFYRIW